MKYPLISNPIKFDLFKEDYTRSVESGNYLLLLARESSIKLVNLISEEGLSIKNTSSTYKVINDWTRLGIIEDRRHELKQWRKFSLIDLIWIRIVSELRSIKYPLNKIKELKLRYYAEEIYVKSDEKIPNVSEGYYTIKSIKYPYTSFNILSILLHMGWEEKDDTYLVMQPTNAGLKFSYDSEEGIFKPYVFFSRHSTISRSEKQLNRLVQQSPLSFVLNFSDIVKKLVIENIAFDKIFFNKHSGLSYELNYNSSYDYVNFNEELKKVELYDMDPDEFLEEVFNPPIS